MFYVHAKSSKNLKFFIHDYLLLDFDLQSFSKNYLPYV